MKIKKVFLSLTLLLISFGILLSACGSNIDTNMAEPMANFEFITQDEEKLSLDELKGDWWITYMSYTDCNIPCIANTRLLGSCAFRKYRDVSMFNNPKNDRIILMLDPPPKS
ncbi:hypothetical protein [Oceanobacillus alkalisoli]|uniref:hypothetical protein n=1 Tax=Oceanobacillus alkalisoli TaxID=2925113 RepID=UPI001F11B843|nr:hypothetical protein [Oceanobacillus alkalisoli]MCF3944226.1 hypothetical protein [Oceanobacillus alkalisoli]